MSSRHRPLLACTTSILAMAAIAKRKTLDLNGPLGSTFQTMAKLAMLVMSPLIYTMKYQWLIFIFFLDYQFLALVKTIGLFSPSTSHVFNDKVEETVLMIKSLPEKFDNATDKLPEIVYQFSIAIRKWLLVHLISLLNFLIISLNQMDRENSRMKEIAIDNYHNLKLLPESSDSLCTIESFSSVAQCFPLENYKDVQKMLKRIDYEEGASEREENDIIDRGKESSSTVKFRDIGKRGIKQEEQHPILQLFESKWLTE